MLKDILLGLSGDLAAMMFISLSLMIKNENELYISGAVLAVIYALLMQAERQRRCYRRFISAAAGLPVLFFFHCHSGLVWAMQASDDAAPSDGLWLLLMLFFSGGALLIGACAAATVSMMRTDMGERNAKQRR